MQTVTRTGIRVVLTPTPQQAYSTGAQLSGASTLSADATVIPAVTAVIPAQHDDGHRCPSNDGVHHCTPLPVLVIDHAYTRNIPAPIVTDDPGCEHGWMSFPIPPALDQGWTVFDTRKDRRTGWRRISIRWSSP